jgi:dTDP-glucose 4,6-dehydratase
MENILVTGGAGFIGSAFIRYLLSSKAFFFGKVINFDKLTYAGDLNNLRSVEHDPRYVFVKGDICDGTLVEKICEDHHIDTIVHFAAETHVDNSILGPKNFLYSNVFGTFSLLEVVRKKRNIHFHHISTDEVYGELGRRGFFDEKSRYKPSSPYSASKAASDHFVMAYVRTYNINATLSHCSNNYGPFQHMEKFIPVIISKALLKKKIPLYGKGENIRDWLYVDDHAEAVWTILKKGRSGEVYDIGGREEKTNKEVVHKILSLLSEALDRPENELFSLIEYVKDRPGHDFRYAIDASKIKKELGWEAKYNFEKGIEETINWYLRKEGITHRLNV